MIKHLLVSHGELLVK